MTYSDLFSELTVRLRSAPAPHPRGYPTTSMHMHLATFTCISPPHMHLLPNLRFLPMHLLMYPYMHLPSHSEVLLFFHVIYSCAARFAALTCTCTCIFMYIPYMHFSPMLHSLASPMHMHLPPCTLHAPISLYAPYMHPCPTCSCVHIIRILVGFCWIWSSFAQCAVYLY